MDAKCDGAIAYELLEEDDEDEWDDDWYDDWDEEEEE